MPHVAERIDALDSLVADKKQCLVAKVRLDNRFPISICKISIGQTLGIGQTRIRELRGGLCEYPRNKL